MKKLVLVPIVLFIWAFHLNQSYAQCANGVLSISNVQATSGLGTYEDPAMGTITYDFCFNLNQFFESSTNWAHGIFISWDNMPPGVRVVQGVSGEQNTQHGFRKWIFIDSLHARSFDLPGPGFYVDDGDGNPTNNYGDSGFGTPKALFPDLLPFCLSATFECGNATTLRPVITVTGDGTTGAWENQDCDGDEFVASTGGPNGNGTIIVCGLVLPLKLISFEAYKQNKENVISWTGIADESFSHYELEKRNNYQSSFVNSFNSFFPQTNAEQSQHKIICIDNKDINQTCYYRLKMIDRDKSFVYSPIISVKSGSNSLVAEFIYPVPTHETIKLKLIDNGTNTTYSVSIFKLDGQKLLDRDFSIKSNGSELEIDIQKLPFGTYLLLINSGSGGQPEMFKFVKA
jgi:hypothetical protein